MESFSLLNYLRGRSRGSATVVDSVANAVIQLPSDTEDDVDDDEGPFFDLKLTPVNDGAAVDDEKKCSSDEDEPEFNFAGVEGLSSETLSPFDDLFFNEKLAPLDPPSVDDDNTSSKTERHDSLLKRATKYRVLMLRFRKPKLAASKAADTPSPKPQHPQKKLFVKFKVEAVPVVSLFTRDHSSRSSGNDTSAAAEDKKVAKEALHKYFEKIKPLYVGVSKRKQRLGQLLSSDAGAGAEKAGDGVESELGAVEETAAVGGGKKSPVVGLKIACKRLGKSRSASAAVAAAPPVLPSGRRDDSLAQLEDGIQSAIAHCKRSFNAIAGAGV